MIQKFKTALVVTAALALLGPTAKADDPKELKPQRASQSLSGIS
jgi:hypothetical protein